MYTATTAVRKIASLNKRIRAVSGGTGAAKTVSILQWLIDYAQSHENEVIDVVSESYPHLDLGAAAEFKRILQANRYWKDDRWNGGAPRFYRFETGSVLSFISFDSVGKAHGPRRDVLFVNEANNMAWPIVDQLITRTKKVVWLDWNPTSDFWFDSEVLGKRDDVDFMGEGGSHPPLTFKDNEGLDQGQRNEILAHKHNANWWRVYGLGLKGQLEGRVYTGWQIIDDIPHEARLEGYGLDFGYDPDPAAIVAVYYYNGGYIFDEVLYQKGLLNSDLADQLKNLPRRPIVADSAEPKSIAELKLYGLTILPAEKGPDSVRHGVKIIQDQRISVTKRSVNLIREYRNYLQAQDKDGAYIVGEYVGPDHALDAARYRMSTLVAIKRREEYVKSLPIPQWQKKRGKNIAV